MKQFFLKQQGSEDLNLFFAGFGQDERPFLKFDYNCDCAIVYDYRSLSFDESLYSSYANIKLIAWSMGVMMASLCLGNSKLVLSGGSLAINGTLEGIDATYGIAPELWQATQEGLNETSLEKFYRRLCPLGEAEQYLKDRPQRPLCELKSELLALYEYSRHPRPDFSYDLAIVGSKDRIVAPSNQKNSWSKHHTPVLEGSYAHYAPNLLAKVLRA